MSSIVPSSMAQSIKSCLSLLSISSLAEMAGVTEDEVWTLITCDRKLLLDFFKPGGVGREALVARIQVTNSFVLVFYN